MKSELMEKLYALKEIAQKNSEKINSIRQDRRLSDEGKREAIEPLHAELKQTATDTRNKLAYMRGQCIGDVGAAVAARSNMGDTGNYAKSAYHFQRLQALPGDMRGFHQAWNEFKQAAEVGDADILRAVTDAMAVRWPEYADRCSEIVGKVKDALLPAGDTAIVNAKARSKALLELVDFCESAAEHAALHTNEPDVMDGILVRALVKLSDFEFSEPKGIEREPLHRALLKLDIPDSPFEPEKGDPNAHRDFLEVAAETAAVDEGIKATA